jgi:hypothetical protein
MKIHHACQCRGESDHDILDILMQKIINLLDHEKEENFRKKPIMINEKKLDVSNKLVPTRLI